MFIFLRANSYALLKPHRMIHQGPRLLAPSDHEVIQVALGIASQAETGDSNQDLVYWIRERLALRILPGGA